MPSFSPDGGDLTEPKEVTIICATPDAVIHYTTNGADPTESDPTVVSGGTVRVDHSLTLKAKAWKTGLIPSDVKNASYVVVLPRAPIAYYSFNNPSDLGYDDSGNGHNLTMPGTVTTVPGLSGNAIHLEAGTSAPYVSTTGMNYPTSKGFSVGYWFKIGSSTDQIAVRDYWCHRDSGETFGLRYDPTQSKADFFVRHAFSPPTIVEALVTVNAGDWVHLLGTYDPAGYVIKLYINAVLVGQQNMPGPMRSEIAPYLYINGSCHGTTQGTIDEVKIYGCVVIPKVECNRDIVGDLNHDCYVNFLDFALLAENWLSCSNPFDPACVPYTIDKGLMGYWSFNEGSGDIAGDSTGNGNAGTITGASWTSGKAGSALDFNGSGDYVDIANTPILNPTQALTVTAWINVRSFTTPWSPVVTHSDWRTNGGTQGYAMEFNLENSGIRFIIDGPGDEGVISEVVPVTNDAWTFVAGIYDGTNVQLYVNATPSTPKPCSISQFQSTSDVYIGRSVAAPERYFSGAIDEVRIYDRALTETEVQYLYRNP